MNLQTFQGPTMADALRQVKTVLGPQAVILHTRTVAVRRWLGLRRAEVCEITAGLGTDIASRDGRRRDREPDRRPAPRQPARDSRDSREEPSPRAAFANDRTTRPLSINTPAALLQNRNEILAQPAAQSAAVLAMSDEMKALKALVANLVTEVRSKHLPSDIDGDLQEHYRNLIENSVAEEIAGDLIRAIRRAHRPELLSNPGFVRQCIAEQIEKLLPTSGPITRTKTTGPHVVALIGPTGVGKTTTIAKLAANLQLRQRKRVGLITMDTYRIAAVDQVRKYAEILRSPLRVVNTPDELKDAIAAMSDCEYVLIDTAGRSPNDHLKLSELKGFLEAAQPDEVHLVVSATISQCAMELAIERFSDVRADRIIFTKLDEASQMGVVLNTMRRVNKALSYVTTGQDVPDNIEVGRGSTIARRILGMEP